MAADLKKLAQLREQVDSMQRESDRAEGALQQILTQLKEEYGCKNLDEAEGLLASLREKLTETEEEYEGALEKFQKKWGSALE